MTYKNYYDKLLLRLSPITNRQVANKRGDIINWTGIIIGVIAFCCIGIFHPIVIKCEYYFSEKIWPLFLVLGLASGISSIFVDNVIFSSMLAVLGFTMLWSIGELKEQTIRVKKGWFPKNPNRTELSSSNVIKKTKTIILTTVGLILLGFAFLGVFLPILPTTPFVLGAVGCLSGTPKIQKRILKVPVFKEYYYNYKNKGGLKRKTTISSLVFLWTMLTISMVVVSKIWLTALLIFIGTAVTAHILWVSRPRVSKISNKSLVGQNESK